MTNTPGMATLPSGAARLLAVEVLLADPEALHDDVLESCLYLLRDRLVEGNESDGEPEAVRDGVDSGS
jgi:hypothetical protein